MLVFLSLKCIKQKRCSGLAIESSESLGTRWVKRYFQSRYFFYVLYMLASYLSGCGCEPSHTKLVPPRNARFTRSHEHNGSL